MEEVKITIPEIKSESIVIVHDKKNIGTIFPKETDVTERVTNAIKDHFDTEDVIIVGSKLSFVKFAISIAVLIDGRKDFVKLEFVRIY